MRFGLGGKRTKSVHTNNNNNNTNTNNNTTTNNNNNNNNNNNMAGDGQTDRLYLASSLLTFSTVFTTLQNETHKKRGEDQDVQGEDSQKRKVHWCPLPPLEGPRGAAVPASPTADRLHVPPPSR